jgi:hypothetical protein
VAPLVQSPPSPSPVALCATLIAHQRKLRIDSPYDICVYIYNETIGTVQRAHLVIKPSQKDQLHARPAPPMTVPFHQNACPKAGQSWSCIHVTDPRSVMHTRNGSPIGYPVPTLWSSVVSHEESRTLLRAVVFICVPVERLYAELTCSAMSLQMKCPTTRHLQGSVSDCSILDF